MKAPAAEGRVTITARNGQVTTVFGGSFQHRQTSRELYLQSGQQIPFDRIKTVEFTRQEPDRAIVRITLVNGAVHEDAVNAGLFPYGFPARTIGELRDQRQQPGTHHIRTLTSRARVAQRSQAAAEVRVRRL